MGVRVHEGCVHFQADTQALVLRPNLRQPHARDDSCVQRPLLLSAVALALLGIGHLRLSLQLVAHRFDRLLVATVDRDLRNELVRGQIPKRFDHRTPERDRSFALVVFVRSPLSALVVASSCSRLEQKTHSGSDLGPNVSVHPFPL